jgi:hypothetical protein
VDLKISRKDITKWIASQKLTKTPADLTPTEIKKAAADLKVDETQITTLLSATQFDAKPVQKPVAQNRLNGELAGGAVDHSYQRKVFDFE